jgi:hypothetical protein
MYKIDGLTITLTKGDSFYCLLTLTKDEQPYEPEDGDSILFGLKKNYKDSTALITKHIPTDTLLLHLEPSDTKDIPVGSYVYDIEVTLANGDVDTVINRARFNIVPEVI